MYPILMDNCRRLNKEERRGKDEWPRSPDTVILISLIHNSVENHAVKICIKLMSLFCTLFKKKTTFAKNISKCCPDGRRSQNFQLPVVNSTYIRQLLEITLFYDAIITAFIRIVNKLSKISIIFFVHFIYSLPTKCTIMEWIKKRQIQEMAEICGLRKVSLSDTWTVQPHDF